MDDYIETAQTICGDDWEVVDESVLVCPCGDTIEWDGECPQGCVSPIRAMGMI